MMGIRARMMNIHDTKGETLVETLVAVLVCALAVMMLMTTTVTAMNINDKVKARDADLAAQQNLAETGSDKIGSGSATLDGKSYSIEYDGGSDLSSYKYSG